MGKPGCPFYVMPPSHTVQKTQINSNLAKDKLQTNAQIPMIETSIHRISPQGTFTIWILGFIWNLGIVFCDFLNALPLGP